jgi:ABC-type transporter Mla MlaB component
VLRITITDFSDGQRWSLEGRLVGPWASELISLWRTRRRQREARKCIIDLNHVTFIDRAGEVVLAEIMSQGAEVIAGGVYTKQKLGNLLNGSKRNRTKKPTNVT